MRTYIVTGAASGIGPAANTHLCGQVILVVVVVDGGSDVVIRGDTTW